MLKQSSNLCITDIALADRTNGSSFLFGLDVLIDFRRFQKYDRWLSSIL